MDWRDSMASRHHPLEAAIRSALAGLPAGQEIETTDLGERLWPRSEREGKKKEVIQMFAVIRALANTSLKDCCRRGEPRLHMRGTMVPYLWSNLKPTAKAVKQVKEEW